MSARRCCSCSQPSPSSTRSSTCGASKRDRGEPGGAPLATGSEQRRHDVREARARVVGQQRSISPRRSSQRAIAKQTRGPTVRSCGSRPEVTMRAGRCLSLALHADESGPTSVRDIAERTGLPQPYLEQILLALKGAGLVRSKRGVGGGYVLARPPAEITLSEIVSAVDGPIVARRLRPAPHRRRLRPRGAVRAAGDLGRRRRADAHPSRLVHPRRHRRQARGERPWPAGERPEIER